MDRFVGEICTVHDFHLGRETEEKREERGSKCGPEVAKSRSAENRSAEVPFHSSSSTRGRLRSRGIVITAAQNGRQKRARSSMSFRAGGVWAKTADRSGKKEKNAAGSLMARQRPRSETQPS